jgi:hypothetical protein
VCGNEAGVLRIHREPGGVEVRRESWPGERIQPVSGTTLAELETAIAARDVPALFALEPELTPFWCPSCGASYCSEHWEWWDVWDEDWPSWRDSVRGRCPQGHERMLED